MAMMTNIYKTHNNVNSVIKSLINSYAENAENWQFRANCKLAQKLLTNNKNDGSIEYSKSTLLSFVDEQIEEFYRAQVSWLGSHDDLVPQAFLFADSEGEGRQ